jgi:hypothetical protein
MKTTQVILFHCYFGMLCPTLSSWKAIRKRSPEDQCSLQMLKLLGTTGLVGTRQKRTLQWVCVDQISSKQKLVFSQEYPRIK